MERKVSGMAPRGVACVSGYMALSTLETGKGTEDGQPCCATPYTSVAVLTAINK